MLRFPRSRSFFRRSNRMKWILFLTFTAVSAAAEGPSTDIKVDQVGYLPALPKLAVVATKEPAAEFTVREVPNGNVVFRGRLAAPGDDPDSGDRVQIADFSKLNKRGAY